MFNLTVAIGTTAWSLLYKERAAAEAARDSIASRPIEPPAAFGYGPGECLRLTDDFGQEATIWPSRVHGMLLEDMDASKFAHIARGLHSARTQKHFEMQVAADPVLKAMTRAQGPEIISPFAPNGRAM